MSKNLRFSEIVARKERRFWAVAAVLGIIQIAFVVAVFSFCDALEADRLARGIDITAMVQEVR